MWTFADSLGNTNVGHLIYLIYCSKKKKPFVWEILHVMVGIHRVLHKSNGHICVPLTNTTPVPRRLEDSVELSSWTDSPPHATVERAVGRCSPPASAEVQNPEGSYLRLGDTALVFWAENFSAKWRRGDTTEDDMAISADFPPVTGIPNEYEPHIFPFHFSTNKPGTAQGLACRPCLVRILLTRTSQRDLDEETRVCFFYQVNTECCTGQSGSSMDGSCQWSPASTSGQVLTLLSL